MQGGKRTSQVHRDNVHHVLCWFSWRNCLLTMSPNCWPRPLFFSPPLPIPYSGQFPQLSLIPRANASSVLRWTDPPTADSGFMTQYFIMQQIAMYVLCLLIISGGKEEGRSVGGVSARPSLSWLKHAFGAFTRLCGIDCKGTTIYPWLEMAFNHSSLW